MYIGVHVKYRLFLSDINPLNAKLNPICHLLTLLGAHHILHVSRIRVNETWTFEYSNVKFHENPSGGIRVVPCGWADEQTSWS